MNNPARKGLPVIITLAVIAAVIAASLTLVVARIWIFPPEVSPVVLAPQEKEALEQKLRVLKQVPAEDPMPRRYEESPEDRIIYLTQREINAVIAADPSLAGKAAIHLSEDMISAVILVTLPDGIPVISGRNVRVEAGVRVGHTGTRLSFIVEGVSILGIPMPSAWLGGLKGRDLIAHDGADGEIRQIFEGVRDLRVEDGRLRIELAE